MRRVTLPALGAVAVWRRAVRAFIANGIAPEQVEWVEEDTAPQLFGVDENIPAIPSGFAMRVPKALLALCDEALCYEDCGADRPRQAAFCACHRLVDAYVHGQIQLNDRTDERVRKVEVMAKAVRRDKHKMKAFVRFREVAQNDAGRRAFVSWFEPTHRIEEAIAGFFTRRFGDMDWVIETPRATIRFVSGVLDVTAQANGKPDLADDAEELWRTYYASIFNPARLMVKAMQAEMPKKYWHNLPEAQLIPDLIASAREREHAMQKAAPGVGSSFAHAVQRQRDGISQSTEHEFPTLEAARQAADSCTRCSLHCAATRTVFGEGPANARLMIVGEQPGDHEDRIGRPLVGPAGQLFDKIAQDAGLDRHSAYVTNAVKHFKFEQRGKRRIHQKPDAGEVRHCKWWLDIERSFVKPELIVALGATAAGALTGRSAQLLKRRGTFEETADGTSVFITVHPSFLLRLPDAETKAEETHRFRNDLITVVETLATLGDDGTKKRAFQPAPDW